jgi:hypothetical protein
MTAHTFKSADGCDWYRECVQRNSKEIAMVIKTATKHFLWTALIAAFLLGCASPPPDLDLSLSKPTSRGHYVAALEPEKTPIPLGTMHAWTVTVTTPAGTPAENVAISIDGAMPQHGHGLPTSPKVTKDLGRGRHLIEGMKFNMPGWWTLTVSVDGAEGPETAIFNLEL